MESESHFSHFPTVKPLIVTVCDKHGQGIVINSMQNTVYGVVTGNILYLSTTEVVLWSQCLHIRLVQFWNHLMPDAGTSLLRRFVELDLIEER